MSPNMPTDQQISSCRHRQRPRCWTCPDRLLDLMDLVADDYVEDDENLYKLTTKGQKFLADRGVGVTRLSGLVGQQAVQVGSALARPPR